MIALFGMAGPWEWVIVLVIVVIFFGVGKLPNVLGQMGKGVKAFKEGMGDGDAEARKEIDVTNASVTEGQKSKVAEADEVRSSS